MKLINAVLIRQFSQTLAYFRYRPFISNHQLLS